MGGSHPLRFPDWALTAVTASLEIETLPNQQLETPSESPLRGAHRRRPQRATAPPP